MKHHYLIQIKFIFLHDYFLYFSPHFLIYTFRFIHLMASISELIMCPCHLSGLSNGSNECIHFVLFPILIHFCITPFSWYVAVDRPNPRRFSSLYSHKTRVDNISIHLGPCCSNSKSSVRRQHIALVK